MSLPTGTQDHYSALLGGALRIEHRAGGELAHPIGVDLEELGRRLILVFTGQSHVSAENNWVVVRRRLDGDSESRELFGCIAEIAGHLAEALATGGWRRVGELMLAEWSCRRRLAETASTERIEALLERALEAGAWGGKNEGQEEQKNLGDAGRHAHR